VPPQTEEKTESGNGLETLEDNDVNDSTVKKIMSTVRAFYETKREREVNSLRVKRTLRFRVRFLSVPKIGVKVAPLLMLTRTFLLCRQRRECIVRKHHQPIADYSVLLLPRNDRYHTSGKHARQRCLGQRTNGLSPSSLLGWVLLFIVYPIADDGVLVFS